MRLVFVNRFYWPDETATGQLLTDLAEALAARGHEVTVIASRPEKLPQGFSSPRHGVHISHVGSTRRNRGHLPGKTLDFATFYVGAIGRLFRRARHDTVVVALTDPPLIGIGAALVAMVRGAKLIHWIQDIYPELAMELTSHSWLRVFRPFRNAAWRRAAACVTLGEDMAARVLEVGVTSSRLAIIPNWAPAGVSSPAAQELSTLRTASGLEGKLVIGYSGNLGRVHDLDAIIELAAQLRHHADIAFAIVGGGAQREQLQSAVAKRALSNVHFFPAQPRAQLSVSLAAADLHLVTLKPGCEDLVFPSKLYGIIAVGRPVIFIGAPECEVARCITQNGFGLAASRDALTALSTAIQRLHTDARERAQLGEAATRFAAAHTSAVAARQWLDLIEQVEGSHRPEKPAISSGQT